MARVTVTVNGVTVECALEDVAAVTAALGGGGSDSDDGDLRPGERRRRGNAGQEESAAEFRRIRANHTKKSLADVAGAMVRSDVRRTTPYAPGGEQ